MSAATPPPSAVPAAPAAPSRTPAPATELPRGELRDVGTVRREAVAIERWGARGLVKVTGDVRVLDASLEGTVTIGGSLSATTAHYRGTIDLEGSLDVRGRLDGHGSARTAGTFHAGEAALQGTVRVLGAATVDRDCSVRGSLSCPSLATGSLDLGGEATIPGATTGTTVSAHLTASSTFGSIRAAKVSLRAKIPNLVEKVLSREVDVTVERIDAEEVDLEAIDVQFVRAPKIALGRNAHITQYEGTIVRQHSSARVGFESKSRPPYGLSR